MADRASHRILPVLPTACLISFGLALATFARILVPGDGADRVLAHFDLYSPSNVATLWSSVLLLMIAGHALARALEEDIRGEVQRRGWQLVALVAVVLSADEQSALHQRVQQAGEALGFGGWVALAPLLLLLLAFIIHALVLLRPRIDPRRFALLTTGFAILLSVPILEYLGNRADFGSFDAFRARSEEVVELVGMLIILAACLPPLPGAVAADVHRVAGLSAARMERVSLLVAVLVLPAAAVAAATWTGERGLPADWLAMALSVLGVLMALSTPGPAARIAAASFALTGLVMVEAGHLDALRAASPSLELNVRLAALAVSLAAVLPLATPSARPATFGLILLTLALATQPIDPLAHYVVTPLIALAAALIAAGALRHRTDRPGETFAAAEPVGAD